ncbi:CLUMA_CG018689, isoform A [Clunio marinus]|uniref:CLUMA_CG018689, isoform A n=1 Tax=Clunio marinus TaxID=568069 RepID=A0A1J1IZM5_9DIPT|nr:CLUMA_CG018689, isoform A [Clunio marinus]
MISSKRKLLTEVGIKDKQSSLKHHSLRDSKYAHKTDEKEGDKRALRRLRLTCVYASKILTISRTYRSE